MGRENICKISSCVSFPSSGKYTFDAAVKHILSLWARTKYQWAEVLAS